MTWGEFCALLSGLMPDTPLGEVVSVRCESDPKRIEHFTPAQRRIYDEWRGRGAAVQTNERIYEKTMQQIEQLFLSMGGLT